MKGLFVVLICMLSSICHAQRILIDDKVMDRALEWNDFRGRADNSVGYKALTYYDVHINYDNIRCKGDTILFDYKLSVSFNPNRSWVKKGFEKDELLKHEQLHFDIAILCGREIDQKMKAELFTKRDYKYKTNKIFNETMAKYAAMQRQYDTETNHSIIVNEQERWNGVIEKEINNNL